ncbi:GDP-fucose transporter [Gracilaria domingensis]|nr:GDP-fucose transporter [Gracilaria domingensis]KAI0559763.1 GDP-fucose transporter [Gracilaria domingensis]
MRWSFQGVLFGVAASFFVAMNAIYVKKKFPIVDNNPWKLTLYNNMNAAIIFIPLIFSFGEPQVILMSENILKLKFWLMMIIGGVFGICISFAVAAQIKYTSPLTHNVSATAKAAAQTVLGLIVYRNPINIWGAASVAVILAGSLFYTLVRRAEMKKKLAAQEALTSKVSEDNRPLLAEGGEAKETK